MARLNRQQVLLLTSWQPPELRDLVTEYPDGYDVVEVYEASHWARRELDRLLAYVPYEDEWATYSPCRWLILEAAGFVELRRPPDGEREWRVRATQFAGEVVSALLLEEDS